MEPPLDLIRLIKVENCRRPKYRPYVDVWVDRHAVVPGLDRRFFASVSIRSPSRIATVTSVVRIYAIHCIHYATHVHVSN